MKVNLLSCLTLSDPMDCSPPGSSVHRIFQARVLEWGAVCANLGQWFTKKAGQKAISVAGLMGSRSDTGMAPRPWRLSALVLRMMSWEAELEES